jgi:hypothetical protein
MKSKAITKLLKYSIQKGVTVVTFRRHILIKRVGHTVLIDLYGPDSSPAGYQRSINIASDYLDLGFWVNRVKGEWYVHRDNGYGIRFSPYKPFTFDITTIG